VAKIDANNGLILKTIHTDRGIFNSRVIAVNNTFYNAEKGRLLFSKPGLSTKIQTKHVHFDKRRRIWRFPLLHDTFEEAQQHAEDQDRLFIPYLQLTEEQWDKLDWRQAENLFLKLARRGVPFVPFPVPLNADLASWIKRQEKALKLLNKSQELLPVFCVYHDVEKFIPLLAGIFSERKAVGIHYFDLMDANVQANLNALYELTYKLPVNSEVPLVVCFCPRRYIKSFSSASSAFLLSLFGIDVISYYVLKPEQVAILEERAPERYASYDSLQGGYSDSENQVDWYGRELTRYQLRAISADEGLAPYMVNLWADYLKEAQDLDILNSRILNDNSADFINTKSRWAVAKVKLFSKGD
jgi:hypothetical protein